MPDFMDEAKQLASEHSDVVDEGFDKAEQAAEQGPRMAMPVRKAGPWTPL